MQRNKDLQVIQMDADEISIFHLYETQHNAPNGIHRDDLPYTEEFEQLRQQYNQANSQNLTQHQFWQKLKDVLKCGVSNINTFLGLPGGSGTSALTAGS